MPPAPTASDGGGTADTLGLRLAAAAVILAAGLFGVCPPLVGRWLAGSPNSCLARAIRAFSGGIILSLALIHIIPEAFEQLEGLLGDYPLGGLVVMAGLVGMQLLEYVATYISMKATQAVAAAAATEEEQQQEEGAKAAAAAPAAAPGECHQRQDHAAAAAAVAAAAHGADVEQGGGAASRCHGKHCAHAVAQEPASAPASAPSPPHHQHQHQHHHDHDGQHQQQRKHGACVSPRRGSELVPSLTHSHGCTRQPACHLPAAKQRVLAATMELGCVVHSLTLGVALGVMREGPPRLLLAFAAVLAVYQAVEGLALGAVLAATPGLSRARRAALALAYALTLPAGVGLGAAVAAGYVYDAGSALVRGVQGAANGVSGGMLLYVALFSLLGPELARHDLLHRPGLFCVLVAALLAGLAVMCVLGIWA